MIMPTYSVTDAWLLSVGPMIREHGIVYFSGSPIDAVHRDINTSHYVCGIVYW